MSSSYVSLVHLVNVHPVFAPSYESEHDQAQHEYGIDQRTYIAHDALERQPDTMKKRDLRRQAAREATQKTVSSLSFLGYC